MIEFRLLYTGNSTNNQREDVSFLRYHHDQSLIFYEVSLEHKCVRHDNHARDHHVQSQTS